MMWLSLIVEILEMRVPPSFFLSFFNGLYFPQPVTDFYFSVSIDV